MSHLFSSVNQFSSFRQFDEKLKFLVQLIRIFMNVFFAELIGTAILILLGNGVVSNALLNESKGKDSGWIVIIFGWGFAVAVAVYLIGWISGAHINPAVTLGFASIGKTPWDLVPKYIFGQFFGAMIGSFLVWVAYFPHWKATSDPIRKLRCFSTQPDLRSNFCNLTTEIIATAVLLVGILGISNPNNGISSGLGPFLIGILISSIGLSLGGPTGFAINPARDLAPRLMHQILPIHGKGSSDWRYAWIPVLGPLIGALLGAHLYQKFFIYF
jgi:glycerol uptake facilitator protein